MKKYYIIQDKINNCYIVAYTINSYDLVQYDIRLGSYDEALGFIKGVTNESDTFFLNASDESKYTVLKEYY